MSALGDLLRVLNARADQLCPYRHECSPGYDCRCEWEAAEDRARCRHTIGSKK